MLPKTNLQSFDQRKFFLSSKIPRNVCEYVYHKKPFSSFRNCIVYFHRMADGSLALVSNNDNRSCTSSNSMVCKNNSKQWLSMKQLSKIDVICRNRSTQKFNVQHRNRETKIQVLVMTSTALSVYR